MSVELKVPAVGESITEVFINKWMKKEGDFAQKDETVAELETDKATFELPAPVSGTITKITTAAAQSAQVGQIIGEMEEGDAKPPAAAKPAKAEPAKPAAKSKDDANGKPKAAPKQKADADGEAEQPEGKPAASSDRVMPAAAAEMARSSVKSQQVVATGPGGRMLKEDVMRAASPAASPAPPKAGGDSSPPAAAATPVHAASAPNTAEEDIVPMSPMRQTIARRLVEAQHTAALLTTFNEVDMSAVMDLRSRFKDEFAKRYDVKLGFMSFFVKAVVDGLKRCPALNAEIRGGNQIAYRNYFNIGIAVSSEKGLVVPVLRNAERLSFAQIESVIGDFGARAKDNKIKLDELAGGTFTISNGGVFGSLMSTPIINPPQSGVLGLHAIQDRPVARDGQVVIRPMMYMALTYDHRIVDGREAVTFLRRVKESAEDPSRMLMEV